MCAGYTEHGIGKRDETKQGCRSDKLTTDVKSLRRLLWLCCRFAAVTRVVKTQESRLSEEHCQSG